MDHRRLRSGIARLLLPLLAFVPGPVGAELVLKLPPGPVRAERTARIEILLLNGESAPIPRELPPGLDLTVASSDGEARVATRCEATGGGGTGMVQSGSFARFACTIDLSGVKPGEATLGVDGGGATPIRVVVEPPAPPGTEEPAPEPYPELDSFMRLAQPWLGNVSAHEPIYFLLGTDLADSKFQFSFKYRLLSPSAETARRSPWVPDLFLGYTQTSFWDLASDSKPFEDTSYKPELFLRSRNLPWRPKGLDGFFVEAGAQHESNGRGGPESRSTNSVYLSPILILYAPGSGAGLAFAPRFRADFENGAENADLADYRGYVDLALMVGKSDGPLFSTLARPAKVGTTWQLDLTWPLGPFGHEGTQIYLQAQYFDGWAENLLDYRRHREILRFGVAFIR